MLTTWDDEFIICVLVKPHMNDFYLYFFIQFFLYTVIYVFYFWKSLLYANNKDK